VIVTDNLFGDILTDLGGAVAGRRRVRRLGQPQPGRTGPSMFEPVHGTAPDIAGQGQGQPHRRDHLGALMLDFLGEADAAARRPPRPASIPSATKGSTTEIGDAVAAKL
jgi:3-isopropylmalate dehydrogenase